MIIYSVTLLSACVLVGIIIGHFIGQLVGVGSDVGGVGFAMLLLIGITAYLEKKGVIDAHFRQGISFWSSMYIPIVVAMAASQNVKAAMDGGVMAITAGAFAVFVSFLFVPVLSRIGREDRIQANTVNKLVKSRYKV